MPQPTASARSPEAPVQFQTAPDRYHHWKLEFEGEIAVLRLDAREDRPLRDGLRPEAQLLRSRGGYRAGRRGGAHPLRASRGADGGDHQRQGPGVLLRGQHPHARPLPPRLQDQLLQVHQRDAAGDGGRLPAQRHPVPGRAERLRRRRRLRAGPGLRRDRPGGRRIERGEPSRGAAPGRAARHRRPHPGGGQATGAPGSGRRVLHPAGGDQGPAGGGLGPGGRAGAAEPVRRGGGGAGPSPRRRRAPPRPAPA